MPDDVKWLIEHSKFMNHKKLYFYGQSEKKISRYYPREEYVYDLALQMKGNCLIASLIIDADDWTGINPVRDKIYISSLFLKRVEGMIW